MATINISTNETAQRNTTGDNDIWNVDAGVSLSVAGNVAFFGGSSFTGNVINVFGTIENTGSFTAMLLQASSTRVNVKAGGTVTSADSAAITFNGNSSSLVNNGIITAATIGVTFSGTEAFFKNNAGADIQAGSVGLRFLGTGVEAENYGSITADVAVRFDTAATTNTFFNAAGGTIETSDSAGQNRAFVGGAGNEQLTNNGTINGDVRLLNGNDLFVNNGGTMNGDVYGGIGNDVYRIDNAAITLVELDGEGTDKVVINQTFTLGDFFENLQLSGATAIDGTGNALGNEIEGNSAINTLTGLDGNDILTGLAGNDVLSGGNGRDVLDGGTARDNLSGGAAADRFVFATGYGVDRVTDFNALGRAHDVLDIRDLVAVTSFTDLKANHMTFVNGDTIITAGRDKIILENVNIADLNAIDFLI